MSGSMEIAEMVLVVGLAGIGLCIPGIMRRKRKALLQAFADQRGGTFEPAGLAGGVRISMTIETYPMAVEVLPETDNRQVTTWKVSLPPPGTVELTIAEEGLGSGLADAVGRRDLELGESRFDQQFSVRTKDLALARRLMTSARCATMVARYPSSKLTTDAESIRLRRVTHGPTKLEELDQGLEFVLELARADVFGGAVLRALPEVVPRTASDGLPYVQVRGPGEISIGAHRLGDTVVTRASNVVTAEAPVPELAIVDGRIDEAALAALPAPARARIRDLGDVRIERTTEQVWVTWPTIEDDPARLLAAIEFLRAFGDVASLGVFR